MAETTPIEWTDRTWSPWEGCTKVGPGCDHCYAEAMNRWLRGGENWGPGAPRREFSEEHWKKLERWNAQAEKKGKREKVFPSICDPFDNEVRPELRARHWAAMMMTPWLDHIILTKRIGNAERMLAAPGMPNVVLPNVWIGATVVNQEEADRDIPKLLATPARVRFLSVEPMLGPIDLHLEMTSVADRLRVASEVAQFGLARRQTRSDWLHWVICGGESGRQARPMHPDWPSDLERQCRIAGVPFLFKQWGEWAPGSGDFGAGKFKTAAIAMDGRVVEGGYDAQAYPRGAESRDGWAMVHLAGKKAAGRLLDGVLHDEFPEVRHG